MATSMRRLDLDKFRQLKQKYRQSPSPDPDNGEATIYQAPRRERESYSAFSPSRRNNHLQQSPEPTNTSDRILHGILSSEERAKVSCIQSGDPSAEKRKQRFEKFRARSRESQSPATNANRYSESHFAVEGSPLRPIVLGEDGIDQEQRFPMQPRARSSASPRSLGDTSSKHSKQSLRTTQSAPPPRLPKASSTSRDRIEEARLEAQDREPFSEIPSTGALDRMEDNRGGVPSPKSPTTHSAQYKSPNRGMPRKTAGRHSLDGPSHSFRSDRFSEKQPRHSIGTLSLGSGDSSTFDTPLRSHTANTSQSRTSADAFDKSGLYQDGELESSTIPTLDLRTVRLLSSKEFTDIIAIHRKHERFHDSQDENRSLQEEKSVNFFVRKRPILANELERGEFDVVGVESKSVVVYQTELKADLKTKLVTPVAFGSDRVFSESCSSEEFYIRVGQPLVLTAKTGGMAAAIILGQRSSGKGLTMGDIEERAVYDVFEPVESPDGLRTGRPSAVAIQLVECAGNECKDLLGISRSTVQVVTKEGGYFWMKGAESKSVICARDLLKIISDAKYRRAEERHKQGHEHQPHVICQILIRQDGRKGSLTLVECGGMGSDAQGDSGESFQALVQCIRARASGGQRENCVPYRSSSLTKILRECLERTSSRVSIVATVSPKATDTEGTIATLRSLSSMMGVGTGQAALSKPRQDDLVLPRQWGHEELVDWLTKKQLLGKPFPANINGRMAMRLTKQQIKTTFYDKCDDAKADKLYVALRAENDRIARIRVKRRIALEKQTAGP